MTKKYSSFKSHQLITESWRKFLKESNGAWEEEEAEYKLGGGGHPSSPEEANPDMLEILTALNKINAMAVDQMYPDEAPDFPGRWPDDSRALPELIQDALQRFEDFVAVTTVSPDAVDSGVQLADLESQIRSFGRNGLAELEEKFMPLYNQLLSLPRG